MVPVATVAEVFDSIQRVKSAAKDFGTNFFPVQKKLQSWIDHQELFVENRGEAAFFFSQGPRFLAFLFLRCGYINLGARTRRIDRG